MVERVRAVSSFVIIQILSDIHSRGCESATSPCKSFIHGRGCESTTFAYKSVRISMVQSSKDRHGE
eukprot:4971576-Prorocentrum_lima.AAC.1